MMAHNSSRPQITPGPRPPPYPKNILFADLHESHKLPILDSKRQISPNGDKFASLYRGLGYISLSYTLIKNAKLFFLMNLSLSKRSVGAHIKSGYDGSSYRGFD